MRKEQLGVGELFLEGSIDKNGVYVTIRDVKQLDKAVKCFAAGAPVDSKAGYAIGCEYTNSTTGAKYINTGTAASSTWVAAGTTTALEGIPLTDTVTTTQYTLEVVSGVLTLVEV